MAATTTFLDKALGDLRHEITDLQKPAKSYNYDLTKLHSILNISRNSLKETEKHQQLILNQLQQFEIVLADINQILRTNTEQREQLEQQQQSGDDIEIRAKIMALNAEALECRAAAVQLQQEARKVLSKAVELETRTNDEIIQEINAKQQEVEKNHAAELERRKRLEEERQRLKEHSHQQQKNVSQEQQSSIIVKPVTSDDEHIHWPMRDFMQNHQNPPCVIRTHPNGISIPITINYLAVSDTENLLDRQEELISTPLKVNFDLTDNDQQFIIIAIPYIIKRSSHRENIIKIRQSNGQWISVESHESTFDTFKDKRFVECKLSQSATCAVISRLKHDKILIQNQLSGRYCSTADQRFTLQWPINVCENDFRIDICVQPVDLMTFTQFREHFSHDCEGLLAVGPIINLNFDDVTLLKPIEFTLPILVQQKKKETQSKTSSSSTSNSNEPNVPQTPTVTPLSQQELIVQQQQQIFKSMLGEDLSNERLVLLYFNSNDNTWQIDSNINLIDSKTHDVITTDMQYLRSRMIIARFDKQIISLKQLQTTICLLEQTLNQRYATLILRRRLFSPTEVCLVCCSQQCTESVDTELRQENYSNTNEHMKEIVLQEGQLLELRFRGNVLPTGNIQQTIPFAFNTYFPFYFESNMSEIDKYSQHLSTYFYGFIQVYTKQKVLRNTSKELDKKKQQIETTKPEWCETDICLAEILVSLPKPSEQFRPVIQKTLTTFAAEGVLTPDLFRDMSANLNGDEWRRLARRLGITRIRIEAIEHDYNDDAPYYMLLTWFKRVPRSSDKVHLLVHALMNINRWDLAQDLQSIKDDKIYQQQTSSKDEQLKILRAPFNIICQRDECIRVWKQIARELLLTTEDINDIEQKYPSKHERCLRSLEHWAKTQTRADIPCLAKIIRTLGFKILAREIENMV